MKHNRGLLFFTITAVSFSLTLTGCQKNYTTPAAVASLSFTEEFDTVANLYKKGWVFNNNSRPQGTATWRQGLGSPAAFSYKAAANEYILVYYGAGSGTATLSSWMLTPEIEMKNGDKFSFYTFAFDPTSPDRLQVRLNLNDNSADVGYTESSVGKFTTLLDDINPNLTTSGYPLTWTKFEYTVTGLSAPSKRRIAFRYYVPNGGPAGINSFAIGIDKFEFSPQ